MRSCPPPHSMCAAILSPSSNIFPLATANPFSSLDPLPAVLRHHDFHMPQYLHRIWLSRLHPPSPPPASAPPPSTRPAPPHGLHGGSHVASPMCLRAIASLTCV